ncbi:carbohydrate kinase family protein [Paracnuella aquatica]|uniref:carbohydrate kinase family protein n=1 Tax=Paracnuella aquatica TaxID=2268757 RepID=UPI000DEF98B4|nr:carbohydrate kinase [Paracnuella aquatica]RPD47430.1 carbohydrate kinase [Paracnuella aquatica]
MMKPDVVCFGEVLWDILPSGEQPGGAPMNVAYHLEKLGLQPAMISRIGKDGRGEKLLHLLEGWMLDIDLIQQDADQPTGVVHAHLSAEHEMSYEIVQPVAWDFIALSDESLKLVLQSQYFIYGSLSARNEVSRNTLFALLKAANKKVFDVNIRMPHFSKEVALQLLQDAYLLKLNEHELPILSGWIDSGGSFEEQVAALQNHFKVPIVVVTRGGKGAVLRMHDRLYQHSGFRVDVADTVGSGDAFLAGLLSQLDSGAAPGQALAFACATGALIASKQGACPGYEPDEIRKLMQQ